MLHVHPNFGTLSDPPANANCDTSGITGTSTTLSPLTPGTLHFIWVAAVLSGYEDHSVVDGVSEHIEVRFWSS